MCMGCLFYVLVVIKHTDEVYCRTFVNGRGRDVIMVDMRRRISRGNVELEVQDNIQVCLLNRDNNTVLNLIFLGNV